MLKKVLAGPDTKLAFAGRIDKITAAGLEGWAINSAKPGSPVVVQVVCGGSVLASTKTSKKRPDISSTIKAAGNCGFSISWKDADQETLAELAARPGDAAIAVRLAGTDVALPTPRALPSIKTLHRQLNAPGAPTSPAFASSRLRSGD